MSKRIRNMHPVTGIVVGVVATLVLSGTAIAVTDTTFTYSSTKTGYLTIHPQAMTPSDDTVANDYFVSYGDARLQTAGGGCFSTGVNLPQNAKITTLQTYYNSLTGANRVMLERNNLSTDAIDLLVDHTIANFEGLRRSVIDTVPIAQRTVWNNVYSYAFAVCLGADDMFEGARLTYTYTTAGD